MYTSIDRFRYARLKMNNFSRRGKRQWILCSLSVSWEFVFGWTSRKISIFPLTPPPLVFRNESNNSYTLFHISSPLHKIYVICNMQRLARVCHSHVLYCNIENVNFLIFTQQIENYLPTIIEFGLGLAKKVTGNYLFT